MPLIPVKLTLLCPAAAACVFDAAATSWCGVTGPSPGAPDAEHPSKTRASKHDLGIEPSCQQVAHGATTTRLVTRYGYDESTPGRMLPLQAYC